MNDTVTLIDRANDVSAFASTDKNRHILNGVYMNGKGTEATDGRVCIRVPYSQIGAEEFPPVASASNERQCAIVPTKSFQDAIRTIPKGMTLPVLHCLRVSTRQHGSNLVAQLTTTDLDQTRVTESKTIDGTYPNLETVWPKDEPKFSIAISAEVLKKVVDYAAKNGLEDGHGYHVINFHFTDNLSAVRFSIPLEDGRKAEGVAMPMRMT